MLIAKSQKIVMNHIKRIENIKQLFLSNQVTSLQISVNSHKSTSKMQIYMSSTSSYKIRRRNLSTINLRLQPKPIKKKLLQKYKKQTTNKMFICLQKLLTVTNKRVPKLPRNKLQTKNSNRTSFLIFQIVLITKNGNSKNRKPPQQ